MTKFCLYVKCYFYRNEGSFTRYTLQNIFYLGVLFVYICCMCGLTITIIVRWR